jgi:hypothetical protein
MEWPDNFPDCCPPEDAREPSEMVYRWIKKDSPTPEDFLTVRDLYPNRPFPENDKECRACANSVYTSRDDMRINRTTGRFRDMNVAVGHLTPDLGRIKHTPSPGTKNSHHSWWIPIDVEAWTLFQAIDITKET